MHLLFHNLDMMIIVAVGVYFNLNLVTVFDMMNICILPFLLKKKKFFSSV